MDDFVVERCGKIKKKRVKCKFGKDWWKYCLYLWKKKLRFDIFNEMVVFLVVKNFLLNCNGDVYLNWKYFCIIVDV